MTLLDGGPEAGITADEIQPGGVNELGASDGAPDTQPCQSDRPCEAGKAEQSPTRVLVVDDDPGIRALLAEMVSAGGYHVVTAIDGLDALTKFNAAHFDIVMTDLAMPRLNGLHLARRCKRMKPGIAIAMVTAWGVQVDREEMEESGIDVVLSKPVRRAEILKTLRELRSGSPRSL